MPDQKMKENKRENRIKMGKMIYQTITKLSKLRSSQLFIQPVDVEYYKDYLDLVAKPMNLKKVIEKFEQGQYHFLCEIHDDLLLISKNCFVYHQNKTNIEEMKKIIGRYIMSLQNAWSNLKKRLDECKIDQYLKLACKEERRQIVNQMEEKKNKIFIKRLQKLDAHPIQVRSGDNDVKVSCNENEIDFDKDILPIGEQSKRREKQGSALGTQSYKRNRYQLKVQSVVGNKVILESVSWNNLLQNQPKWREQLKQENIGQQKNDDQEKMQLRKKGLELNQESIASLSGYSQTVTIVKEKKLVEHNDESEQSETFLTSNARSIKQRQEQKELKKEEKQRVFSKQIETPVVVINIDDQQSVLIRQKIRQSNYERLKEEIKREEEQKSETETQQQFQNQVERDMGKLFSESIYKLAKGLKWIAKCIMLHEPRNICNIHGQDEDYDQDEKIEMSQDMKKCEQCINFKSDLNRSMKLKKMNTHQYLKKALQTQVSLISSGDLNLKSLLTFLSQLALFIDLVGQAYLNWRISDKFFVVLVEIFSCLEDIIEVKHLGQQFKQILQRNKSICNISEPAQRQNCRYQKIKTRSRIKYGERYPKINPLKKSYLRYKNTLRVYGYLSEKNKEQAQFSDALSKDDALKYLKSKQLGPNATSNENIEEKGNQNEYENEQFSGIPSSTKISKKRGRSRRIKRSRKQEQIERSVAQTLVDEQLEEDEQFLQQYALRSNALVIQKYENKLNFNWQSVYEKAIGSPPELIYFEDETNATNL